MVSKVFIVGCGMGNPRLLTQEAREALQESDLIIGAPRLVRECAGFSAERLELVSANEIASVLASSNATTASVVMSGDVGFYSGTTRLLPLLEGMDVQLVPGVSSLVYFCARLKLPWQDVFSASAHGRDCDVAGIVRCHSMSFFLTDGKHTVSSLCATLADYGLGDVRVAVGEQLSYDDERIRWGTAREFACSEASPLAVMLVINEAPRNEEIFSPYLGDDAFVRGNVPMTKEEIRELAICKLRIHPHDVVWDVGAGTGSVTIELARAAFLGHVYAVEKNTAACELIRANRDRFGLGNVSIVAGEAPEILGDLSPADCVFVGGSAGRLEDILRAVYAANPKARVCITAVMLETMAEALRCIHELDLQNVQVVQVSIARSHEIGTHHLMRAENPIVLLCAEGVSAEGVSAEGVSAEGVSAGGASAGGVSRHGEEGGA